MARKAFREVRLILPMEPDIEISASEEASALAASVAMSPDRIDELRMAVLEACINAFEHSDAPDRKIHVTLSLVGEERPEKVQVTVRDTGVGFSAERWDQEDEDLVGRTPRKRGWGLSIIRGLMDEVAIDTSSHGTTVVMSKLL